MPLIQPPITASGGDQSVTSVSGTSGEAILAGAPVLFDDSGGAPRVVRADANGAGQTVFAVGINLSTVVGAGSPVSVITSGRVATLDAVWDLPTPIAADVGKPVFLSENVGKLTLTAPTTLGSTVLRVGYIAEGGVGTTTITVSLGDPTIN